MVNHGAGSHHKRSGLVSGLLIGAVALLVLVPACSSSSIPTASTTTTSLTTSSLPLVTVPHQESAQIAECTATAKTVEVALGAYQAEKGAYPSPGPWSAASYADNYQPLTASGGGGGGPFLPETPTTTSYVIAFDAAGHVWVAPPGSYGPYNRGEDIDVNPDVCDAAIG